MLCRRRVVLDDAMAEINVYWKAKLFIPEEQGRSRSDSVQTGLLTDEHEELGESDQPVIVEDVTGRVYTAADLPPGTVIYVEAPPGPLPRIAVAAQEAGFHVVHAGQAPAPRIKP